MKAMKSLFGRRGSRAPSDRSLLGEGSASRAALHRAASGVTRADTTPRRGSASRPAYNRGSKSEGVPAPHAPDENPRANLAAQRREKKKPLELPKSEFLLAEVQPSQANVQHLPEREEEWEAIEFLVHSGASVTVIGEGTVKDVAAFQPGPIRQGR